MLHMPKTMRQLAVVQFFSWFALFSMWIYTTQAVTSHIFHTTDTTSADYNKGGDWVGVCFSVYNGLSAMVALLLPIIARATSRRLPHLLCPGAGGSGARCPARPAHPAGHQPALHPHAVPVFGWLGPDFHPLYSGLPLHLTVNGRG